MNELSTLIFVASAQLIAFAIYLWGERDGGTDDEETETTTG